MATIEQVKEVAATKVEQAKEAAGAAGQAISDFFQGSPFGTPVGSKIEQATDGSLVSENWGLNMEICDFINMTEEGPHDAVRALRKRFQTQVGRNNQTVLYTLTVLETCVKNCDVRFLQLVLQKEFCQEMVKIIGPKNDPPQVVQERVLRLIQVWADAFRQQDPIFHGVCEVYDELKGKGLEFPPTDTEAMAPILTPKPTVAPVAPAAAAPVVDGGPPSGEPVAPSDQQLVQLRSQLDVVQGNMRVLREMLTELAPGQESSEDYQLMVELSTVLRKMQRRVAELLQSVANEQVTNELLLVNDELNNLFAKYDRYMANRSNPDKQTPAAADANQASGGALIDLGPPEGDKKPLADQLQELNVSQATTAAAPVAEAEAKAAGDLAKSDGGVAADQISVSLADAMQQKTDGPVAGSDGSASAAASKETGKTEPAAAAGEHLA